MDSSRTSKFYPEQLKSAVLRAWDALSTTGLWMDEISELLEQSTLCQEKLLARALAHMQINISDAVESEPLIPPTKDMGVDQYLWTPQPYGLLCVLLRLWLNITPMIMGCASATSTQVILRMNEYQSHPPLPYRKIL